MAEHPNKFSWLRLMSPPESGAVGPLTAVLRVFGGVALVSAATTFLVQQWDTAGGIQRYLGLLALTLLLPCVAFICGIGMKEGRGARAVLGSLLTLVPVHFGVLAGLLYSQFHWDAGPADTPRYALWIAPGPWEALGTVALATVVLGPLMFLAFRTMARSHHRLLALVYLAVNGALLLPTRDGTVMGLLFAGLFVGLAVLERWVWSRSPAMRTVEGAWARIVLFVPLVLIAGRQIQLYAVTEVFVAISCSCVAVLLFLLGPGLTRGWGRALQWLSAAFLVTAWLLWTRVVDDAVHFSPSHWLLFFGLPLGTLMLLASPFALGPGTEFRVLAGAIAGVTSVAAIVAEPTLSASVAVMSVGLTLVVLGYLARRPIVVVVGCLFAVSGLGFHLYLAVQHYSLVAWGGLAAIGAAVIVGASVLERYGSQLREWHRALGA